MEKKYFTNKHIIFTNFLLILTSIGLCIVPFIETFEFDTLMQGTMICTGLIGLGLSLWLFRSLAYPILDNDVLIIKHPILESLSKTYRYSDIHYAVISIQESNKGGQSLRLFIELDTGEQISKTIMTDCKQKIELAAELKNKGVSDIPVNNRKICREEEKVYKSIKHIIILFACFAIYATILGYFIYFFYDDGFWEDVDKWGCAGLGALILGIFIVISMVSNYVIIGQDKITIRNVLFSFRRLELYFSDLKRINITPQMMFEGVLKEQKDGKIQKRTRVLGAISSAQIDSMKAELKERNLF